MFTLARASTLLFIVVFGALLDQASHAVPKCDNKCRERLYVYNCQFKYCQRHSIPTCINCIGGDSLCEINANDTKTSYKCELSGDMITKTTDPDEECITKCPCNSTGWVETSNSTYDTPVSIPGYICKE